MNWLPKLSICTGLLAILIVPAIALAQQAQHIAERGRMLFNGDREALSAITATLNGRTIPAALFPCASCHGRDGSGRTEADVVAPSILRGKGGLDRPARTAAGGIRPAYGLDDFAAAVTGGVAPGGTTLGARMPRYRLGPDDITVLWAWLDALPAAQRQGVEPDELVFAVTGVAGQEAQVEEVWTRLAAPVGVLSQRFGRRIVLRAEIHRLGAAACPGAGALALIVAGLDRDRMLLSEARQCSVPAILPFDDIVGNEDALDIRGMSAPLQMQWKALREAAGSPARIVVPERQAAWEVEALGFAGIVASATGAGDTLLLPWGLDRSRPPDRPATVYAPLSSSRSGYRDWLRKGHRLRLATADTDVAGGSPGKAYEWLTELLDKASLIAGSDPTRAGFIEAIDAVELGPGPDPMLSYPGFRLSGTRKVLLLAVDN